MATAKNLAQGAVLFLAILVSGVAWAQTSEGALAGSVTDPTGAVVPKATVSALSPQFGQPHKTYTDQVGTYRLEGLQPGVYSITFASPGFETLTVQGVVISGSLTTSINGKLKLAASQQVIEVQATASQVIDTQSGQLGENIGHEEVAELPNTFLNPAELALTLPGVHDTPQGQGAVNSYVTNGIAFSVNGTRPQANNFLIDGQDDNDYGITGQAYQPTNWGAIQEVTILTNAYSAEFGRGGGSVTNYIYKSGTNNFHGDLWEINRNSALAAIPAEDQVSNPISKNPYDNENTFGFDAGGPVVKDKLFFFGAAQWDREKQAVTGPVFNLPTAEGIATLDTLLPNANIALLLKSIGSLVSPGLKGVTMIATGPNGGGAQVQIGEFQFSNVNTASYFVDWNYRMDWHFTDRDTLTGSAIRSVGSLSPDDFANPKAIPNFQTDQSATTQIFRGQWSHTFAPTLLNELRLSYTSINFGFDLTPAVAASSLASTPYIQFGSDIDFPAIGVNSDFPQGRAHQAWQVQEALSKTTGKHTIKAGADITILNVNDTLPLNTRGSITYNSGTFAGAGSPPVSESWTSLGNFINDTTGDAPGMISKGFGNPNVNTGANMFAPYIEDTWRIRNNLTLELGLRYEYWGALANAIPYPSFNTGLGFGLPSITSAVGFANLFASKQIPDKRNFAPRVGLAYTPHWGNFLFGDGKTTIRAGYGIFYDGLYSNIVDNSVESQPNSYGGTLPAQTNNGPAMASTFPGLAPTPNPTLFLNSMASNLHNPMTQQWNVNVQRELPLGFVLTLAYVGTRGTHLFTNQDFNPAIGLSATTFSYVYMNPNFGEIGIHTNAADSKYNSGQIEVERKIHTLVLRGAYTYSKFMDDSSTITSFNLSPFVSAYSQVLNNQSSDWGPSAFDQRNRFTLAYVWQAPYVHGNAFLRALTDQWQWSSIATIESGTPNSVEDGFDNTFNGHTNSRPNLANPNAPFNSVGIDGGNAYVGLTPGVFYDFQCVWYTAGPCASKPESAYHFIIPAQTINAAGLYVGPPGNVGRNSVFGPGQVYFDTAIQRNFPIHFWKLENQTISFRAEFFNALNHPNLFTPSYVLTDINFNNTAITINGGRQIKLWLKYSF